MRSNIQGQRIEEWRTDYNNERPHMALGGLTLSEWTQVRVRITRPINHGRPCPKIGGRQHKMAHAKGRTKASSCA
ncbi:MAG: transposase [Azospirillum sp.]|nr:transposase [Azospirillum sp.]MCA3265252.1 transposase [Azospirillum sp.]